MRFPYIPILFLLFHCTGSLGQDFEHYGPFKAEGPIPSDFTTLSSEKFNRAKDDLGAIATGSRSDRTRQDFLLESNFLIDQVLLSGRVLFNDPVSNYLGQILDTLLVNEPELRKKVRVYAVRSSIVNSFTTDDGIILVNLGLLAQLENEAQLAFILCHELAHFTEHHVINAYLQSEELKKNSTQFKRGTFDEKLLAKSRYSKELEKEADRLGFERFLNSSYSTTTLLNVFEVMRYAHLPFDDIPFDRTFFNREYYKVNDSYFLNRVRPVEASEIEGPEQNTHPSPTERQQLLRRSLGRSTDKDRADHVVSGSDFEKFRSAARFELSVLYLKANRPVMSIYNSYLLLQSHPDNFYLEKNIALSLYTLSKFKTGGNFGQIHPGFSHIEGESQQVYHLFYRLRPEEMCILAVGYIWNLKTRHPEDADLRLMSTDLLKDLMMKYHVPGMIARSKPPAGWDEPDTTGIQGKYDRLKEKGKDNPKLTMITYGLVDLFDDPEFKEQFDRLERERWGNSHNDTFLNEVQRDSKDDLRYWKNHGFALGAQKVVVVSPTYAKLDLRKRQKHKFLHSETAKGKLMKQLNRSADLLNLELEILDQTELDSSQVGQFNDITFLNEWVDLRFVQLDVSMVNLPTEEIDRIIDRYGTELFTWTGVINYRENKPLMYFYLLYALIPPAIPFAIYYLARPNYDTYYYCITFNLRTGEPVLVNYNNYRKRDANDIINSSIYDSLWQMKRQPKAKE